MSQSTIKFMVLGDSQYLVTVAETPLKVQGLTDCRTLQLAVSAPPQVVNNGILDYGQSLWDTLNAAHDGVRQVLQNVAGSGGHTLIFEMPRCEALERHYWETLYDGNGFLSLNPSYAVSRVAASAVGDFAPVELGDSIKVMAFVSALKRSGMNQVNGLIAAVQHSVDAGFPVQLELYVAEEGLLEMPLPAFVTRRPIPNSFVELKSQLDFMETDILHFFCHGESVADEQKLHLGTVTDHDAESDVSSLQISARGLSEYFLAAKRKPLLVVLNACDGAAPTPAASSMAFRLAADGMPAVIGMMEPFPLGSADCFTECFYTNLLHLLMQAEHNGWTGDAVTAALHSALCRAREALQGPAQATNIREWAVPVMYLREKRLRVSPRAGAPKAAEPAMAGGGPPPSVPTLSDQDRSRITHVAGVLRILTPDTPPEVRQQFLQALQGIPPVYWPDAFGRLSGN